MDDKSLSMKIRKSTDNLEVLMNGGKLVNPDDGSVLTFVEIFLEDDNLNGEAFALEEFANLEEYVAPKSREEELQERIDDLEAQLAAVSGGFIEPKHQKPKTIYDKNSKLKIAQEWKLDRLNEKPMKLKEMAAKYDISSNYLVSILKEFGVYEPKKKNRKPNASIKEVGGFNE